ncbi:Small nuclear ribonucleoprotein SmD3b [Camellia lanceoleosa]|nr:Small nuclear ribonucleoprotein SmD3b [Camellia lanceoleosa]
MSRSLGIPVKLLHEAAGHMVTVELKSGELYRGSMVECEDNWNCQLENITFLLSFLISFLNLMKGKGSTIGVGENRLCNARFAGRGAPLVESLYPL